MKGVVSFEGAILLPQKTMAQYQENQLKSEAVLEVARLMLVAARTAPKGRGTDNLYMLVLTQEDIGKLAFVMKEMGERLNNSIFVRDSLNILQADALILMGTRIKALGLKDCGLCGFANCEEKNKHPEIACVFNTGDLGIAIGSAVSIAMDHRVDNRIMYTVGYAAMKAGVLPDDIKIAYGIPLSVSSKNPFFDRK